MMISNIASCFCWAISVTIIRLNSWKLKATICIRILFKASCTTNTENNEYEKTNNYQPCCGEPNRIGSPYMAYDCLIGKYYWLQKNILIDHFILNLASIWLLLHVLGIETNWQNNIRQISDAVFANYTKCIQNIFTIDSQGQT